MMRRWADSAARARAWARPARARGELRGTGLRFDLLRHGRAPLTVQLLLHAHHRVAIAVHVHMPRTARREPNVHERASMSSRVLIRRATLRTALRERLVESIRSRPVAATAPASPTAHPSRDTFVLRTHTGLVSRWLHHQVERYRTQRVTAHATVRTLITPGMRERATYLRERSQLARHPAHAPESPARAPGAASPRVPAPHRPERSLHQSWTIRSDRLPHVRVRTPALRDVRPAARAAAGPDTPNAPLRLPPASRRASAPAAPRTAHTFAPSPQPLAVAARAAVPAPPPVERIERSLRESMTTIVQHTVRHEVERVLRPDTQLSRRLRESVQAELYDDIVFERERLGER